MDPNQALDDLKTIRQIMDRTQKAAGGDGGWFMVIAGVMWLVGFTGNQFLSDEYAGWLWAAANVVALLAMIWVGMRLARTSGISTPMWQPILVFWIVLGVFSVLLGWLFHINDGNRIGLLILLVVAMGYSQIGALFHHWLIGTTGILIAVLTIGAFFLVPAYFALVMAILGGGLLIGSGLWMVHSGR
ncbi:MAG: hypothetical protein GY832_01060 [Chloroflexi bacterium]|nr:hypothetical protein [Chloroflexota bacterium]